MISILVVEDTDLKVREIRKVIESIPEIDCIEYVNDLVNARRLLEQRNFDLLILDLQLPERFGDVTQEVAGSDFLAEIKTSQRLKKPFHIIGLTSHENLFKEYNESFYNDVWVLLHYVVNESTWSEQLKNKINYLIQSKREIKDSINLEFQFDLAIITALRHTELESVLNLPGSWKSFSMNNDATEYHKGIFADGDRKISVIAAAAPQMGMVAVNTLAMKVIQSFRPKYLAMTGIAGGVKGIGNYGDILIADISFDSGSGKIKTDSQDNAKFEPDYKSIELETDLKEAFISCKGKREFLDEIKRAWPADKPDTELNLHIGPLATGAGVIENNKIIEDIKGHSRKLIGIDMETYGLFYAAKHCTKPRPLGAFSMKSISDFSDPLKNDKFQKYSAYTSANFLYKFVIAKLKLD